MLRQLHSISGLIAAIFAIILATTGAILSLNPVLERMDAVIPSSEQVSVAELASKVAQHYSGLKQVEQIERTPSGTTRVYYTEEDRVGIDRVNPSTGQAIAPYEPSSFARWIKNLHRSLMLDTPGRAVVGISALLLILLSVSGVMLLAIRLGGWRQLFSPVRGTLNQRLHIEFGRVAVIALLLSALTGAYLSATTFELVSQGQEGEPELPMEVTNGLPAAIDTLSVLKETDLNDLKELVFPYPDDSMGVYSLSTSDGVGYIDQVSGEWLSYETHDSTYVLYQFIYMLHTGEGIWWLGLILGLAALSVPMMSVTGAIIWWKRHQSKPKLNANSSASSADSIILVGSESNTTWGFAKTLHDSLIKANYRVHTAPMNQLASNYNSAKRLFILTATYGDGDAPASANQFLTKLQRISKTPQFTTAVLGFGDRQYPQFCRYAKEVEEALSAKGWQQLLPFDTIDRQSPQEFNRWGINLGKVLGIELALNHIPVKPKTMTLELTERVDYGVEVQAPTAVLRFKVPNKSGKTNLPHFEVGDLVGILPPNSTMPRLYSLASESKDDTLEICVRQQPNGLCSNFLYDLPIGGTIDAFIKPNPNFRPVSGKAPVVLIGAGTGIGPLVGFIRHNTAHNPMHLYWGGRCPNSDFLYEPELNTYLKDKRLTELNAVFSRTDEHAYVQDKIILDGEELRQLIENGAQVLICGGRNMANSVMTALNEVLSPLGIDVATLKAQGRYREDVY